MYFNGLIRAFKLSFKIEKLRSQTLAKKVFLSFKKKREFVELKSQIKDICLDKYEVNLIAKCFDHLLAYSTRKMQLRSLLKIYYHTRNKKKLQKSYNILKINNAHNTVKRLEYEHHLNKHNKRVLRKCIKALKHICHKRKNDKKHYKLLQEKVNKKMIKHYLFIMLIKFNKAKLEQ